MLNASPKGAGTSSEECTKIEIKHRETWNITSNLEAEFYSETLMLDASLMSGAILLLFQLFKSKLLANSHHYAKI